MPNLSTYEEERRNVALQAALDLARINNDGLDPDQLVDSAKTIDTFLKGPNPNANT